MSASCTSYSPAHDVQLLGEPRSGASIFKLGPALKQCPTKETYQPGDVCLA